jgi:thiol-disulfide isomerase/thioredoxin
MKLVGQMTLPAARSAVMDLNRKYLALQKKDLSRPDNLKPNDHLKDMSEGEQILRNIIEPYKGKIILLDIWGTWCGPCRAALAHSQELYERMKEYDMIFLYMANNSKEKTWKAIIEEYKVSGDNVVHYNLPADQQSAVENFLKVNSWPTYKLIDRDGNILEVNANPSHIDSFEKMIKSMK